jgi:hypothetical protein
MYVNLPFSLKLLTIDTICAIINAYKQPVTLFKIDLARAFRQIPIDPLDVPFLGLHWGGADYVDKSLVFGYRHGSAICQRISDLVRYILKCRHVLVVNYIDDFIGIVLTARAAYAFNTTIQTLQDIGLVISDNKTIAPTIKCVCLGISVNTFHYTISIRGEKLNLILNMCKHFQKFKKVTKNQIQLLLGSLIYIHKAIPPARLFVNRIIALLKKAPSSGFIHWPRLP